MKSSHEEVLVKVLTSPPPAKDLGRLFLACLLAFSGLFFAGAGGEIDASAGVAQRGPITGDWRVDFDRGKPDLVSLTMIRGNPRTGDGTRSDGPVALGELQGLTREQAFGTAQTVKFRIVREAGTFECEGTFAGGKGSGRWRLVPDESFLAAMRSRGYSLSSDKEIFESALFGVSVKAIDDLTSAGYARIPFDKLIETRIFDVTPELINEMRAEGYTNQTLDELVEVRIFKIDRKFIDEMQSLGFGRQPLRQLVDMRSQNVTPEYAREMRAEGFNLTPQELVDFKVFGVTTGFIKELKAEGYSSITPREIVELKVYKIDADFIRRAKAKGFSQLTIDRLVNMRMNGALK
ncbi:MAG TPA: hypothetical protein VF538_16135 [Pyrinomonadaceae bacterium]